MTVASVVTRLCLLALASASVQSVVAAPSPDRPFVTLAYDGTGDFGPDTPGTKTAGWQEALDHCVSHHQDLYVKGGWGGRKAIYHISDTIRIPASQDFRIDGGVYVLNWTGPIGKDLLVVDSGMDCRYRLGILVYGGHGAALRVKPENPVPIDQVAVFTDSEITASSIADPHPFQRGKREGGAGVLFDTRAAPITHADFRFTAVLNFATCIESVSQGKGFVYNYLSCGNLHTNADESTLLRFGTRSNQNTLSLRIGVDQGAAGVTGIDVQGSGNCFDVTTRGGLAEGKTLVLNETASGNQINLLSGNGSVLGLVTDFATKPTNQVTSAGTPLPIREVDLPKGISSHRQRLVPATVQLLGRGVKGWSITRGDTEVDLGDARNVLLSVGDEVKVESALPCRLVVIPLKTR